ncbi:hypothetical protein EZS27_024268 [termite gut metagenome]|uniref:DUF4297 domain-containing protein n=1 Tax=termite gut metagenome TaxID=433724 RepID=A0A5J4QZ53_9ZZZZ
MAKQPNNATATVKGIIYQFLVALKKCFELQEGESVYIETFGDVSVFGEETEQIETKFYKKDLTDMDINVWKTLNNWMDDKFDLDSFNVLILLTTQKIKPSSEWYQWNEKHISQKLITINKMKNNYTKKQKNRKDIVAIINRIFDNSKHERLKTIVGNFFIDHNALNDNDFYRKIRDEYAKGVPTIQKDKFIRTMLGFIISPTTINNNNWQIKYATFSKEIEELTKTLVEATTVFPEKKLLKDIKTEEYNEHLFVEKIREIQYEKVIPEAVTNYAQTQELIFQEIAKSHIVSKSLENYDEEIYQNYQIRYRRECRNIDAQKDKIKKSKDFYDDSMLADSDKTFHAYSSIPNYFRQGVLHIRANNADCDLKWLLDDEKDS